jgi:hypothetical protein
MRIAARGTEKARCGRESVDRERLGEEAQSLGAGSVGRSRQSTFAVTTKISLLWVFPLIGVLLTLAIVFHDLHQTAVDAPIVNLAGRQRLLSQQLLAHVEWCATGATKIGRRLRISLTPLIARSISSNTVATWRRVRHSPPRRPRPNRNSTR